MLSSITRLTIREAYLIENDDMCASSMWFMYLGVGVGRFVMINYSTVRHLAWTGMKISTLCSHIDSISIYLFLGSAIFDFAFFVQSFS